MRNVYKVLAYLIAAGVVVQAMAMVFAIAGMEKWISEGGVLDKAVRESPETPFPEVTGFIVHGINGTIVIPALSLLLLVCSFFAKVPRSVRWAGLVFLLVAIQVNLGFAGPDIPALGAVHGLNAIALFTAALHTGRRTRAAATAPAPQPELTGAV
jgi:hypothetical protein